MSSIELSEWCTINGENTHRGLEITLNQMQRIKLIAGFWLSMTLEQKCSDVSDAKKGPHFPSLSIVINSSFHNHNDQWRKYTQRSSLHSKSNVMKLTVKELLNFGELEIKVQIISIFLLSILTSSHLSIRRPLNEHENVSMRYE